MTDSRLPSQNRWRIVQCPKIYVLFIVRQFSKQTVEVDTPEAWNFEREILSSWRSVFATGILANSMENSHLQSRFRTKILAAQPKSFTAETVETGGDG